MKIGVISDTHSHPVPPAVLKALQQTDLIIHAGDLCMKEDLDVLARIKEVKGVVGNMDDKSIARIFPQKDIIDCDGVKIGITHGYGPREKVLDGVKKVFAKDQVQAVVFGHSHVAMNENINGVLYFNPGSPNDVCALERSYGVLEVSRGKVTGRIVKVG